MTAAPLRAPKIAGTVEPGMEVKAEASSPAVAAASITPAENPSTISFHLCCRERIVSPRSIPIAVEHPTDSKTIIKTFMVRGIIAYFPVSAS
jgi:hypothetical protein